MCFSDLLLQVKDTSMALEKDPDQINPGLWGILRRSVFSGGPSSTRIVYLSSGLTCAIVLGICTLVYAGVYLWKGLADPNYGLFLTGSWTALFGFASTTQKHKNRTAEDGTDKANP